MSIGDGGSEHRQVQAQDEIEVKGAVNLEPDEGCEEYQCIKTDTKRQVFNKNVCKVA
jgi:hypothetical protein